MSTPNSNNPGKRKPLIGDNSPFRKMAERTVETGNTDYKEARQVDITLLQTNPRQPRRAMNEESLQELTEDIRLRGVLQPPIVRPLPGTDRFEIVVGERRYRAARAAGLTTIPVIVRELNDEQAEITSLVENIQRENLSLTDEANYFLMLQEKYGYSLQDIADNIAHKSKSYVDVRLNLARIPKLLAAVESGRIGIQDANLLARNKEKLPDILKHLETSLKNAQSVFLKDGQPAASAGATAPGSGATPLPFRTIARDIKAVAKKLERIDVSQKKLALETVEELERQIVALKRQIRTI